MFTVQSECVLAHETYPMGRMELNVNEVRLLNATS
jgi:hypothetical protein